jgi:hypothetical protein
MKARAYLGELRERELPDGSFRDDIEGQREGE